MLVGLLTPVPYSTLDRPDFPNKSYWRMIAVISGTAYFIVAVAFGRSYHAVVSGITAGLFYAGGLWLGLVLGRTLTAFAVGYLTIIVLFSTLFAALWRLQGSEAFAGLPPDPGLAVFLYFSLVTATTIGYGDIVPHSGSARWIACVEVIACLAWTLVVFAALSVQFSSNSKEGSK
jgi:hypothetical protein